MRETSARDVVTLWFFTTALRECRGPWAAKLAPEINRSRAKASVRMWNLVSTAIAASIADSGMEYLTHQVRKRVGRWSNNRRVKDILACIGHVRFTPKSGHVRRNWACPLRANSGLMQRSKKDCYSITSSARASSEDHDSSLCYLGWPNSADKPHLFLAGRVRCHHDDLRFSRAKTEH
jgi:hypothetical protein